MRIVTGNRTHKLRRGLVEATLFGLVIRRSPGGKPFRRKFVEHFRDGFSRSASFGL